MTMTWRRIIRFRPGTCSLGSGSVFLPPLWCGAQEVRPSRIPSLNTTVTRATSSGTGENHRRLGNMNQRRGDVLLLGDVLFDRRNVFIIKSRSS
jgi:hypothetical protein